MTNKDEKTEDHVRVVILRKSTQLHCLKYTFVYKFVTQ